MNILFLGTPDFAVASLQALVETGHNIVAVVTAIDKPSGRGLELTQTPVKKYALSQNLKVLQPDKLKNPAFIESLQSLNIDLGIVVAFRMMPEVLWSLPKMGTFNLHASLLPQYRGAAPINWAVINGETETGITTFFLKHEIDTGEIIHREVVKIDEDETASELYIRLMKVGATLVVKTVDDIKHNTVKTIPQEESSDLKSAPKLFKEMAEVNFNQPTKVVYDFIRGMTSFPGAWGILFDKKTIFIKVRHVIEAHTKQPASVDIDNKSYLHIYCTDGYISVLQLKPEAKKVMDVKDFCNGRNS
jgi:methionyl-tRNA formyltransferase